MRKKTMTKEQLQRWADKLSFEDKELIKDCIFRLYTVSEDMRIERKKSTTQVYKTITINKDSLDDKTIEEWERISKAVKNAEEQFMEAQLAEDVEKMIKDYNDRGLRDETIQDKTQNQKDI